jgi:hypothetical protein
VSEAEVILVDVTGPSSPVGAGDQARVVRELIEYAQFGVAEADHGFLLMERELGEYRLPAGFYDVFYAPQASPQASVGAEFGGQFRLVGIDWCVRPVVRRELVVEIVTYWEALTPTEEEIQPAFYFWNDKDELVRVQSEIPMMSWLPTWSWEPGQVVRVSLPPLPVGDLPLVGVALVRPGFEPTDKEGRLAPITPTTRQDLSLLEHDTILELVKP